MKVDQRAPRRIRSIAALMAAGLMAGALAAPAEAQSSRGRAQDDTQDPRDERRPRGKQKDQDQQPRGGPPPRGAIQQGVPPRVPGGPPGAPPPRQAVPQPPPQRIDPPGPRTAPQPPPRATVQPRGDQDGRPPRGAFDKGPPPRPTPPTASPSPEPRRDGPGRDDRGRDGPRRDGPGFARPGAPGRDGPGRDDAGRDGPRRDGPGFARPGAPGRDGPGRDGPGRDDPRRDGPGFARPGAPGRDGPGRDDPRRDGPRRDGPGFARPGGPGGPFAGRPEGPRRIDDVRGRRVESVSKSGARIIQEPGNRTIVRQDNRTIITRNEGAVFNTFTRGAKHNRRRDGGTETVYERPGGVRVFSEFDRDGRLLRRYRRDRSGREYVFVDNRRFYRNLAVGVGVGALATAAIVTLAPPAHSLPPDRYIVDYDRASEDELYETVIAPPVERLERGYSLDEVRYSRSLRQRMRRIDLDNINFETGSFEVDPDQYDKLARIARVLQRVIDRDPTEVFLIEGHTDAIGSDEDNLSLSDHRAESVARILVEHFEIPIENLTTQGYGEQFLKIDTQEAERANRRVAVRRITPLLSRADR